MGCGIHVLGYGFRGGTLHYTWDSILRGQFTLPSEQARFSQRGSERRKEVIVDVTMRR